MESKPVDAAHMNMATRWPQQTAGCRLTGSSIIPARIAKEHVREMAYHLLKFSARR
jgi:hypothetical protein